MHGNAAAVYPTSTLGAAKQRWDVAQARVKPAQAWRDKDLAALLVEQQIEIKNVKAQLAAIRVIEGPQGEQGEPGESASSEAIEELSHIVHQTKHLLKQLTLKVQRNTKKIDETIATLTLLGIPREFVPVLNGVVEVAGVKHKISLIPQTIRYMPLTGDVFVFDEDGKEVDDDTYEPGEKIILDLQLFQ